MNLTENQFIEFNENGKTKLKKLKCNNHYIKICLKILLTN